MRHFAENTHKFLLAMIEAGFERTEAHRILCAIMHGRKTPQVEEAPVFGKLLLHLINSGSFFSRSEAVEIICAMMQSGRGLDAV